MTAKKYRADTIADALGEVKRDLGRDAVILKTRSYRKGGLFGLIGGRTRWEILASVGDDLGQVSDAGQYVSQTSLDRLQEATDDQDVIDSDLFESGSVADGELCENMPEESPAGRRSDALETQVSQLRQMVETLLRRPGLVAGEVPDVHDLGGYLQSQGVEWQVAQGLIGQLRSCLGEAELADRDTCGRKMHELVAASIATVEPTKLGHSGKPGPRVISLIGPTGVGKTTTIAKLAANYKLKEGARVGLITIDTYRIAAVDQLRTYADIIEVPMRTVLDPREMQKAMYALRGMDVVLLDTTGRSQNDMLRLGQLRRFLASAEADEVHLVISATAGQACRDGILASFVPLGADRLVVSKVDESDGWGAVLNLAHMSKKPISYVTSGQEVPDDIAVGDSQVIAGRIMEGFNCA